MSFSTPVADWRRAFARSLYPSLKPLDIIFHAACAIIGRDIIRFTMLSQIALPNALIVSTGSVNAFTNPSVNGCSRSIKESSRSFGSVMALKIASPTASTTSIKVSRMAWPTFNTLLKSSWPLIDPLKYAINAPNAPAIASMINPTGFAASAKNAFPNDCACCAAPPIPGAICWRFPFIPSNAFP